MRPRNHTPKQLATAAGTVLKALEEGAQMTTAELREFTKWNTDDTRDILRGLVNVGLVVQCSRGKIGIFALPQFASLVNHRTSTTPPEATPPPFWARSVFDYGMRPDQ